MPRLVSFRGLIQIFRRASPPLSYGIPPGGFSLTGECQKLKKTVEGSDLILAETLSLWLL